MLVTLKDKIQRKINQFKFKRSIRKLKDTEFCIVSSTCVGSRIYQILGRQYNTPFVGLRIQPPCFAKLVADFETYMAKDLTFAPNSNVEEASTFHLRPSSLRRSEVERP